MENVIIAFSRRGLLKRMAVMEDLAKADEDRFVAEMTDRMGLRIRELMRAVNAARTGHVIDDSEGPVLELVREMGRELYQDALAARVDATEAAASFPPSGRVRASDERSGAAQPFGADAFRAGAMDASAVLGPGHGGGGPGGHAGRSRPGRRQRGGA